VTILAALDGLISDTIDRLASMIAVKASQTDAHRQATHDRLTSYLQDPSRGQGRELVARCARAEVKSYLQEIAEAAGMPYPGPVGFLQALRDQLAQASVTTPDSPPEALQDPASQPGYRCSDPECPEPTHAAWRGEWLQPELDDRGQD
jgi:hypothetical protein